MKNHLLLLICLFLFIIIPAKAQVKSALIDDKELNEMYLALEKDSVIKSLINNIGNPVTVLLDYNE